MEMTYSNGHGDDEDPKGWRRFVKPVVVGLIGLGVIALVWHFATDTAGVKRMEAPQVTTVIPLPPPPPPPPPKVKPPPEKVPEVQTPTLKPTVTPKAETLKPTDNQPKQMTENAPAQAGTDNFGIGAGDGTGMAGGNGGGAFGNATYQQYLQATLQQTVERDKKVQDSGGGARFAVGISVWLDPTGHITKVVIGHTTGDPKLDQAVIDALQTLGRLDEPPPPAWQYPVRLNLQGRQPG